MSWMRAGGMRRGHRLVLGVAVVAAVGLATVGPISATGASPESRGRPAAGAVHAAATGDHPTVPETVGEPLVLTHGPPRAMMVAGSYAYVVTGDFSGRLERFHRSDMTLIDHLPLNDVVYLPDWTGVAISDGSFAYIVKGHDGNGLTSVRKVRLSDMTKVEGTSSFGRGDLDRFHPYSAITDGTHGYFAGEWRTLGTPGFQSGAVIKVRLSDMTVVDTLFVDEGQGNFISATTDGVFGYFGSGTSPGVVVKVHLSNMTTAASLTLAEGENRITAAVTDGVFGYFATDSSQGRVVKVRLSDMTRVAAVDLVGQTDHGPPPSESLCAPGSVTCYRSFQIATAVTDGTFGYFAGGNWSGSRPASLVKVRLSDLLVVGEVVLGHDLQATGAWPRQSVTDGTYGYVAFSDRRTVVKVRLRPALQQPGPPVGVHVVPGLGQLAVWWQPPLVGGAPTAYTVAAIAFDDGMSSGACVVSAASQHCIVPGLDPTGRYRVEVVASNSVGSSDPSAAAPPPPQSVTPCGGSETPEFDDVPAGRYFTRATSMLRLRGITTGLQGTNDFHPHGDVTRAEMAAFLWRMAGQPASAEWCGFLDHDSIPGFARAGACWLRQTGITDNDPFRPQVRVSRAQMAAFLHRFAGLPAASEWCGFVDHDSIPGFARAGACWLKEAGITDNDPFRPQAQVTRAQMAAFLYRLGAAQNLWVRIDD